MDQVILDDIPFSKYKIPRHNSITSNLPMSEKAKEGDVRKEFPKDISFQILFSFIMSVSPADTGKHKTEAILLRNVGGLEALHCSFRCPFIHHILIQQNRSTLDLGSAKRQANNITRLRSLSVTERQRNGERF